MGVESDKKHVIGYIRSYRVSCKSNGWVSSLREYIMAKSVGNRYIPTFYNLAIECCDLM
jgi:hypothetical protein